MAFLLPLLIKAGTAIGGALGGKAGTALAGSSAISGALSNRAKTITQENNPVYDDITGSFRDNLINLYSSLGDDGTFWPSYQVQGLNNLQAVGDNSNQLLKNILTSRGIANTTAGSGAIFNNDLFNRVSKANFLNNIPLLRDQRSRDILKEKSSFLQSLPIGSRTETTDPGNLLGGAATGFSSALANIYGRMAGAKGGN